MAGRRKAEIQLQMQIESQEEWEELLSKEGLNVIDVYQEWCGPCTGMVSNFKKIKNEMGDPLLKFCTAKADMIDSLDKYRGHCEPCFLFYAGGCLVAVVRGANSPKILRTITEQLKQEHKVLDGGSERKEIKDPFIAQLEAKEKETDKEEEEEEEEMNRLRYKGEIINYGDTLELSEGVKEVTVALIKPDAVEAGKVDQILEDIQAAGIEILKHEERKLTEDEVRQFYTHLQDQDFFEDLVKFMTSGPSHVLALTKGKTGENIIDEFRDLIGPTDVEEAKTQKPESLRAKHGQQTFMNALHGSSSAEMATRELAFFFPDFVVPHVDGKAPKLQRTLALVRPEAFRLHKEDIIAKIRESGFKVAMQKEMQLTKEMAEEFYKEHEGQEYFDQLVTNMSSGPVLALGLARDDAVEGWRNMLGPKEVNKAKEEAPESLRAKFAVDDAINSLHGSDSEDTAKKELEFFFPMEQTVAVIKPDAEGTKDEIIDRIHEAGFRIAARKETKLSKEIAEEFYADHKDKDYYNDLIEHMTSGPTYLMVLSREGAVDGWRSMIGPTDPTQAKEVSPDSIRATYGESILKNAVHGSSDPEHAKKTIKTIFGDLKFTPDGAALETIDEEAEKDEEGFAAEVPTPGKADKPVSDSTKDAEESSPEVKQQQLDEQRAKEEETRQETQKEETKEEEKTDEQPSTEQKTDEQPSTEQKTDEPSTEESKQEQSKEEQQEGKQKEILSDSENQKEREQSAKSQKAQEQSAKNGEQTEKSMTKREQSAESSKEREKSAKSQKEREKSAKSQKGGEQSKSLEQEKSDLNKQKETKQSGEIIKEEKQEEAPKEEKTEEETKAPSPKPSETEAKPSESEAQPQSETEAKPEEQQQEESKTEEKPSEETEQKTEESTAQGEEKKEETQSEEKAPDTQTTEESKEEEKKEEAKPEGGD
ncbi:thioredoxin domain-containing protein 6-like isoform X16 [Mytilus californianus]|uniref:thioredoxin domain-containing protein 6-like isoform X14 n=1 Tax=Mytilus californianus TaxID=6549 RepID=UPI0022478DC9|nr:thioredoxin domain-containing protein 6-like isoform X14 [Mytilus californianus]XP_052079972.1 thioredoxin domain-containing protein 6-like isoform X15 [Mytilus californianus]XP_052079973.1 thioredoxin domain-containing protein 6-like isoform X16 [Mytilus californianus]